MIDERKEYLYMGKMTVYHGSYTMINKPHIQKSKRTEDFGPGF